MEEEGKTFHNLEVLGILCEIDRFTAHVMFFGCDEPFHSSP